MADRLPVEETEMIWGLRRIGVVHRRSVETAEGLTAQPPLFLGRRNRTRRLWQR